MTRKNTAQPDPETLGTDLNIEDVRTEAELCAKWARHVLACCGGNKSVAARVLGIDRRSLYRRLGYVWPGDASRGTKRNRAPVREIAAAYKKQEETGAASN